jgi:2-iminobutanoate/2-iminopropanoate deaminase
MKTIIQTPDAPAAIGPYSQAVVVGSLMFCSGQIPLDPKTGAMVEGGIGEQTTRVLDNIDALLRAGGCGFDDIVKTTIFLADMGDFGAVNELYAKRFSGNFPARSTVQAARLPRDAKVEIEVIVAKR